MSHDLYRHPHLQTADPDSRREYRQARRRWRLPMRNTYGGTATSSDRSTSRNVLHTNGSPIPTDHPAEPRFNALAVPASSGVHYRWTRWAEGSSGSRFRPTPSRSASPPALVRRRRYRAADLAAMSRSAKSSHARGEPLSGSILTDPLARSQQCRRMPQLNEAFRGRGITFAFDAAS